MIRHKGDISSLSKSELAEAGKDFIMAGMHKAAIETLKDALETKSQGNDSIKNEDILLLLTRAYRLHGWKKEAISCLIATWQINKNDGNLQLIKEEAELLGHTLEQTTASS